MLRISAIEFAADAGPVQSLYISIGREQRCLPLNRTLLIIFTERRVSECLDVSGRHANALTPPGNSNRHLGAFIIIPLYNLHRDSQLILVLLFIGSTSLLQIGFICWWPGHVRNKNGHLLPPIFFVICHCQFTLPANAKCLLLAAAAHNWSNLPFLFFIFAAIAN